MAYLNLNSCLESSAWQKYEKYHKRTNDEGVNLQHAHKPLNRKGWKRRRKDENPNLNKKLISTQSINFVI